MKQEPAGECFILPKPCQGFGQGFFPIIRCNRKQVYGTNQVAYTCFLLLMMSHKKRGIQEKGYHVFSMHFFYDYISASNIRK
jgi:hypothetical protein